MRRIRTLLATEHRVLADSLRARLEEDERLLVVDAVCSGLAAEAALRSLRPDVAVLATDLPERDALDLLRWIQAEQPETATVVLHAEEDSELALRALRCGALGFVTAYTSAAVLASAIVGATRGETWISPRLLTDVLRVADRSRDATGELAARLNVLTPRERDVLSGLVGGLDRHTLAAMLSMSDNTVKTHVRNILAKLDVHSSLEAVSLAVRAGMVSVGPTLTTMPR